MSSASTRTSADHVMNDAADVRSPREMNPLFYGVLTGIRAARIRLLRASCDATATVGCAANIRDLFAAQFTRRTSMASSHTSPAKPWNVRAPYGWAWILMLAAELYAICGTRCAAMGGDIENR